MVNASAAEAAERRPAQRPDGRGPARRSAPIGLWVAGLLGVGLTLRAIHFVTGRSLWIDEARVGINVLSRSYAGLLRPMDFDQTASPVFLWLVKLSASILGPSEQALRLVPFLAGVALLGLMYPLARRFVSPPAALFAVAVFCLSPPLIYYSNEIKPYMVDALAAATLTFLALRWVETGGSRRLGLGLTVVGAVAVWVSTPSPAILAAIGAALLLCPGVDRRRRVSYVATAGAVWLASLLAVFLTTHQAAAGNPYLQEFWAFRFLDPGRPDVLARVWVAWRDVFWELIIGGSAEPPMPRGVMVAATTLTLTVVGLAGLGAYALVSSGAAWRLALLVFPLLVVAAAATVRLYPIGLRVLLFAAPLLLVLLAAGAGQVIERWGPRRARPLWIGFAVILLATPLARDASFAAAPHRWDGHRRGIREFERLAAPGDPVYVSAGSLPAWIFYTMDWDRPDTALVAMVARVASYGGPAFENAAPRDTVTSEDGDGLVYRSGGRTIVIGLSTGMQIKAGQELARDRPDPGWGEMEAARMRAAADPHIWAILSHLYRVENGFYRRIYNAGGRLEYRSSDGETHLVKYRFCDPCSPPWDQSPRSPGGE